MDITSDRSELTHKHREVHTKYLLCHLILSFAIIYKANNCLKDTIKEDPKRYRAYLHKAVHVSSQLDIGTLRY